MTYFIISSMSFFVVFTGRVNAIVKQKNCSKTKKTYCAQTLCIFQGAKTFQFVSILDMENVPSKPSAARVIIFGSGKFLV